MDSENKSGCAILALLIIAMLAARTLDNGLTPILKDVPIYIALPITVAIGWGFWLVLVWLASLIEK